MGSVNLRQYHRGVITELRGKAKTGNSRGPVLIGGKPILRRLGEIETGPVLAVRRIFWSKPA